MTPDQISKLPPAIKLVADDLRHAGCLGEDDSYRLLTYCLQMQEERDAANKRIKFLNDYSERRFDDAKNFYDELQTAEATIATLTRERDEAWEQLHLCDDIKLDQSMACCISDLQKDREYQFQRANEWREQAEPQRIRAETAESEVSRLKGELEKCEEIALGICRQLNADASYAARHGNYESRERYESMARVAEGIATQIAALSHTPEGGK